MHFQVHYPAPQPNSNEICVLSFDDARTKNAFDSRFWKEFPRHIQEESSKPATKVIVIRGNNKCFTSGLNIFDFQQFAQDNINRPEWRIDQKYAALHARIHLMQEAFNELERAKALIVACIDGPCIGAGMELALACDIVFCTKDAFFCIKETEYGFAADLGLLQRGPNKCTKNPSLFHELAATACKFGAEEAFAIGMVGRIFDSEGQMLNHALSLSIASKTKECLCEVKQNILYSRCNGTQRALDFARQRNAALLLGNPLVSAKL